MSWVDFIGVLNAIGFWTIHSSKDVVDRCINGRKRIGSKYPTTFWNCGQALDAESANSTQFKSAAVNLYRLHIALSKIAVIEYRVRAYNGLTLGLLIAVALSMVVGFVSGITPMSSDSAAATSGSSIVEWTLYYIPIGLLCVQLALVWRIHQARLFISSVIDDEIADVLEWDKD